MDVVLRRPLYGDGFSQLDLIGGYRRCATGGRSLGILIDRRNGWGTQGSVTHLTDTFRTLNNFHGAQLGAVWTYRECDMWLDFVGKVALGNTHADVTIDGSTTVTDVAGNVVTTAEGLLARSTNIGRFEDDEFAVVPEVGITLGYAMTCGLHATLGYRFIYWSDVLRSGDQIDLNVNVSDPLVGATRPAVPFATTDFWAQGLNVGLECRY